MTISTIGNAREPGDVQALAHGESKGARRAAEAELLPLPPFAVSQWDDLMTSLAVMMLRQKHDERVTSDQQSAAASKAQQDAHARKIGKMRELADDVFAQGLVEGALEGAAAVVTASSALARFEGETKEARAKARPSAPEAKSLAERSTELLRNANLADAASKGLGAGSKLGGAWARRAQELDREAMAVADTDIDRAKSSAESASTASRRAYDDVRETIGAIRQYLGAKSQLANAALIRG